MVIHKPPYISVRFVMWIRSSASSKGVSVIKITYEKTEISALYNQNISKMSAATFLNAKHKIIK